MKGEGLRWPAMRLPKSVQARGRSPAHLPVAV